MTESELLENIIQDLKSGHNAISEKEASALLQATISAFDNILDKGEAIEIEDFGEFTKKTNPVSSVVFFKPVERLTERIKLKK